MFYDLAVPLDLKEAEARFSYLAKNGKKITLVEKRKKRSYSQNRYLHLIVGLFAVSTGYTLAEAKLLYKLQYKEVYCYTKRNQKFIRSSADLDTKEMAESISRFRNWSNSEAGIYLPSANEEHLLNSIERELEKYDNKIYI